MLAHTGEPGDVVNVGVGLALIVVAVEEVALAAVQPAELV